MPPSPPPVVAEGEDIAYATLLPDPALKALLRVLVIGSILVILEKRQSEIFIKKI